MIAQSIAASSRSPGQFGQDKAAPRSVMADSQQVEREAMEYDVVVVGGGPAGTRGRDPHQAAGGRGRARGVGLRAREGLRDRRAHPVGRRDRSDRAERAVPELEGTGRAADHAGDRGPFFVSCPKARPRQCRTPSCRRRSPIPAASTPAASATWSAGWASRPRDSASRSSPASPPPRCCTTRTARSRAWPPATWASARTASPPPTSSPASNCTASTRCSPRARAATSASR